MSGPYSRYRRICKLYRYFYHSPQTCDSFQSASTVCFPRVLRPRPLVIHGCHCSEGSALPSLLFTAALSVDCCAETDGICARAGEVNGGDVRENVKLVCDPKRLRARGGPLCLLPSSQIRGELSYFMLKTCQFAVHRRYMYNFNILFLHYVD